jgi:hypothetical protein
MTSRAAETREVRRFRFRSSTPPLIICWLAGLGAPFACPRVAIAQEQGESPLAPPPSVSPPIPRSDMAVPCPAGAEGDARVLLDLVVETDGSVSSAVVFEGSAPCAEAATIAALTWRFFPARRGDTAVAARIRVRVDFHPSSPVARRPPSTAAPAATISSTTTPPPAPSASTPTPAGVASPSSAATAPEAPLDVTVRGSRREIGQTTLLAADASSSSSTNTAALRVLP